MACCDHPALYCPIDYAESGVSAVCGYARRHVSTRQIRDFVDLLDSAALTFTKGVGETVHFYPAFGGATGRQLNDLIIREEGQIKTVDATWWFDCQAEGDTLIVNNKRTTFNARNLNSPYWKGAIRHYRGVFLATGIGEGKMTDGKNKHFLVESEKPILLGCVYRKFPNGCYSSAIITRDEHLRFSPYHDKAFPLMLPHDKQFLELWLGDEREDHPAIAGLLENPRIFSDLKITPVRTFKGGAVAGESLILTKD